MSEHAPRVRPARAGDEAELRRMAGLARDHAAGQRGGEVLLGADPDRFAPPDPAAPPGEVVLLGCLGDVPVGYATAWLVDAEGGPQAEIGVLFVEADARSVGVGQALVQALLEWARLHRCRGIGSVALPGDRDTKNFFEAAGLVARLIAVHRPLDVVAPGA